MNLLGLLSEHTSSQIDRIDIIDLVGLVSASRDKPVGRIKDEIRAADSKWMTSAANDDSISTALDFVVRLRLFVKAGLEDGTRTLSQVVAAELPERVAR